MEILTFFAERPMVVLALCLGAGFLLGNLRILKKLTKGVFNVTLATLLTAFLFSVLIQLSGKRMIIPDMLTGFFFALFAFAIGYAGGPNLAAASGRNGKAFAKQVALCVFYVLCALAAAFGISRLFGLSSPGSAVGMLAGAQTQSSIVALDGVSAELEGQKMVTYAACYIVGTLCMMVFCGSVAPAFLRSEKMADDLNGSVAPGITQKQLSLTDMVLHYKQKKREMSKAAEAPAAEAVPAIQLRTYKICEGAAVIGKSVSDLETQGFQQIEDAVSGSGRRFEVVSLCRCIDGVRTFPKLEEGMDALTLQADDIMVVMGDVRHIYDRQNDGIEEVYDEELLHAKLISGEVLITAKPQEGQSVDTFVRAQLTYCGVVPEYIERLGKKLELTAEIQTGDILRVSGLSVNASGTERSALKEFVSKVGYLRETGAESKISGIMLLIALAALISSVKLCGISLGTGCLSMLLGLGLGYLREKKRNTKLYDATYISPGALSFIQKLGLNLFIAGKTLGAELDLALFDASFAKALLCAALVALIPLILGLIFGKRVLKLHPVELLAGLCGSGTCSAALNMLNEKTGSNEFAGSYAVPYALGDVLLTLSGILFIAIL